MTVPPNRLLSGLCLSVVYVNEFILIVCCDNVLLEDRRRGPSSFHMPQFVKVPIYTRNSAVAYKLRAIFLWQMDPCGTRNLQDIDLIRFDNLYSPFQPNDVKALKLGFTFVFALVLHMLSVFLRDYLVFMLFLVIVMLIFCHYQPSDWQGRLSQCFVPVERMAGWLAFAICRPHNSPCVVMTIFLVRFSFFTMCLCAIKYNIKSVSSTQTFSQYS